jgi:hypothetical protein
LWLPETVYADFGNPIWNNWSGYSAKQQFTKKGRSGVCWQFHGAKAEIRCDLSIESSYLDIICSLTNKSPDTFPNVSFQNCLHFPKAPSFAGKNGETVYIRSNGEWIPVSSTRHWFGRQDQALSNTTKFFFRSDTLQNGRYPSCVDDRNVDPERSDHPLIVKVSSDGKRSIGIAGEDWDFVFHNASPMLGCIHSQPLPVRVEPLEEATIKQRIYLCEGNHEELLEQHANAPITVA